MKLPRSLRSSAAGVFAAILLSSPIVASSLDRAGARIFSQYRADSRYDLSSQPESGDQLGEALGTGDFNGDGYQDLAIGVPSEDFGSSSSQLTNSGWVTVIYGGPAGLDASPGIEDVPWDQEGAIEGGPESGDEFGQSIAVGDFNGDGFDDLAAGVPGEDIGSTSNAGAVNVIYGSPDGLTTAGNRLFSQDTERDGAAVPGAAEVSDRFGFSLAAGDFDGDGNDDLAVGSPYEDLGSSSSGVNVGMVVVLYGQRNLGLHPSRSRAITRDSSGMREPRGAGDLFGYTLAAGDFDGDNYHDLAIGSPFDDRGPQNVGVVDLVFGSRTGLDTLTNQVLTLDGMRNDVAGEASDSFGLALASGNFDGDSYDDLAIGIPQRDIEDLFDVGATLVGYGSPAGITGQRSNFLVQGIAGLTGLRSSNDRFGSAFASGDLDGNGADDLMVAVWNDDVVYQGSQVRSTGAVHVIYSEVGSGVSSFGNELLDRSVVGQPVAGDGFSQAIAAADFNGDGASDLVVSAPLREVTDSNNASILNAGEVIVVPGVFGGGPCSPTEISLCLNANRFRVEVTWGGGGGAIGTGIAVPRTADTGFFWFFNQENLELVVKVLDARGVNGHFWVFYGSLTDVAYTLTVTDEETGRVRTYVNPAGTFASAGDTTAFADSSSGTLAPPTASSMLESAGAFPLDFSQAEETLDLEQISEAMEGCQANQLALCLNRDRFFVQVDWRDFQGNRGDGQAVDLTDDTGAFWFFDEANLELVLKVLDGTAINGHYWVFFGALTNIEYEISVLDTHTGRVVRYVNPANRFASEGDTTALPQ